MKIKNIVREFVKSKISFVNSGAWGPPVEISYFTKFEVVVFIQRSYGGPRKSFRATNYGPLRNGYCSGQFHMSHLVSEYFCDLRNFMNLTD